MKKLTIEISDRVLAELKTQMLVKQMGGNLYGVLDEATCKIITALEEGAESITLKYKNEE